VAPRVRPSLGLEQLENRTTPSLTSLLPLPNPLAGPVILPSVNAPVQTAAPAAPQATSSPITINLVVIRIDLPSQGLLGSQSAPILVTVITRELPAAAPIADVFSPALASFFASLDRAISTVSDAPIFGPSLGRIGNPGSAGGLLGRAGTIDMTNAPGLLSPVTFVPQNLLQGSALQGQTGNATQDVAGTVSRGFLTFPNGTFFIESVIASADLGFAPALLVPPTAVPDNGAPQAAPGNEGPTYGAEAVAPVVPGDEVPEVQSPAPEEPAQVQAAAFVPTHLLETLRVDPIGLVTALSAAVGVWYHGSRRLQRKPRLRPTEDAERDA